MTINNNPSPRNWRNRYSNAPRGRKVIGWIALGILLGVLCGILSSCLGFFGQADSAQAENASSWRTSLANAIAGDSATQTETAGDSAATVDLEGFVADPAVVEQLKLLGFGSYDEFVIAAGLQLGTAPDGTIVTPWEVNTCPGEMDGCVRIHREKGGIDGITIIPFQFRNPVAYCIDGWLNGASARETYGRSGPTDALRGSGIKPDFNGLAEGFTLRTRARQEHVDSLRGVDTSTCGVAAGWEGSSAPAESESTRTPTEAGSAPRATTVPSQGTGGASTSSTTWSEASARSEFGLGDEARLVPTGICYAVTGTNADGIFKIKNPRTDWVDGYRLEASDPPVIRPGETDPKTSFPPGFDGLAVGATLCPPGS